MKCKAIAYPKFSTFLEKAFVKRGNEIIGS